MCIYVYITVYNSETFAALLISNTIQCDEHSKFKHVHWFKFNRYKKLKHPTLDVCNHVKHNQLIDKKLYIFYITKFILWKKLCVQLNDRIQNSYCKTITCHLNIILCFLGKRSLLNDQNYSYFYTRWPLFYNAHVKHFICK